MLYDFGVFGSVIRLSGDQVGAVYVVTAIASGNVYHVAKEDKKYFVLQDNRQISDSGYTTRKAAIEFIATLERPLTADQLELLASLDELAKEDNMQVEQTTDQTIDAVTAATEILGDTMNVEQTAIVEVATEQTADQATTVDVAPNADDSASVATISVNAELLPSVKIRQGKGKDDLTLPQVANKILNNGVVTDVLGNLSESSQSLLQAANLAVVVNENFAKVDASGLTAAQRKRVAASNTRLQKAITSLVRIADMNANTLLAVLSKGSKVAQKDDHLRGIVKQIWASVASVVGSADDFGIVAIADLALSYIISPNTDEVGTYNVKFTLGKFVKGAFVPDEDKVFFISKINFEQFDVARQKDVANKDSQSQIVKARKQVAVYVDLLIHRLASLNQVK